MKKIFFTLLAFLIFIFPSIISACSVPPDILHEWKISTQWEKITIQYSLIAWKNLHKPIAQILESGSKKPLNTDNLASILESQILPDHTITFNNNPVELHFLTGSIAPSNTTTEDYAYSPQVMLTAQFTTPLIFDPQSENVFFGTFDKTKLQNISPLIHPYIITDLQQSILPEKYVIDEKNVPYDIFPFQNTEIVIKNHIKEDDDINTFELFIGPKTNKYQDPFWLKIWTNNREQNNITPQNTEKPTQNSTLFQVGETLKYFFTSTDNTIRALGLFIALVVGMFHGLLPGHSKALLGTYMMSNATSKIKEVLLLIGSVTFSHTFFIFFLATIIIFLGKWLSHLVGYITIISAIAYILFGGYFLYQWGKQIKTLNEPSFLSEHGANCDCAFHRAPSLQKTFFTGILAGCNPCIDALALFVLALQAGDVYYGIAMIITFSLGLGLMLGFLAFSVQYSKTILQAKYKNLAQKITAWITTIAGLVIIFLGILHFF